MADERKITNLFGEIQCFIIQDKKRKVHPPNSVIFDFNIILIHCGAPITFLHDGWSAGNRSWASDMISCRKLASLPTSYMEKTLVRLYFITCKTVGNVECPNISRFRGDKMLIDKSADCWERRWLPPRYGSSLDRFIFCRVCPPFRQPLDDEIKIQKNDFSLSIPETGGRAALPPQHYFSHYGRKLNFTLLFLFLCQGTTGVREQEAGRVLERAFLPR